MPGSYVVPTLDQAHAFLVAVWKAFFPSSNVGSKFSYHWKRLRVFAGGITDLHSHIASAQNDVMPDTSTGPFLTRWGGITGVAKKTATAARGSNALRVFGVVGSVFSADDQLTHAPTGFTFQNTVGGTIGAAGYVDVDVEAISTGAATRLNAGESLTFTSPEPGIKATATLVLPLNQDGFDDEQDPAYSVRVNNQLGEPRMGGSQPDFVAWAESIVGVAEAFCYPNRAGVGTTDIAAFHTGDGADRSLTDQENAAVLAYIASVAPAQVAATGGSLRMLTTVADPQAVEITVITNGDLAYAFDWDDSTPLTVLAYTPATLSVQFTTDVPGSMIAGDRIVFRGVASAQDGSVFTIETISAVDTIILRETPAVDLVATDVGYSGGPLTEMIRDAIVAHMNGEIVYASAGVPIAASEAGSVPLANLTILADGIGPANPGGIYGTWNGSLLRAVLSKLASYPTGARNIDVVTPADDYDAIDPPFPSDSTINFITPLSVLIRNGAT